MLIGDLFGYGFFGCHVLGGRLRLNDAENTDLAYFAPDALPAEVDSLWRGRIALALTNSPAADFC